MTTHTNTKQSSKNLLLEVIEKPEEYNLEKKVRAIKTSLEYFIEKNALAAGLEKDEIKKLNEKLKLRQEAVSNLEKETQVLQTIHQQTDQLLREEKDYIPF